MSDHFVPDTREQARWARRAAPAELELWALSGGPGEPDLPRQAAALAEIKRRDRRIVRRQLLVTALAALAACASAVAAIVSAFFGGPRSQRSSSASGPNAAKLKP
jgi:ferric-dicitrate binding protein FerR (iron transport regulator)